MSPHAPGCPSASGHDLTARGAQRGVLRRPSPSGVSRVSVTIRDFDDYACQRATARSGDHPPELHGPASRFVLDACGVVLSAPDSRATAGSMAGRLLGVDRIYCGSAVSDHCAPLENQLVISQVIRGRYWVDDGDRELRVGPGEVHCLRPDRSHRAGWEDLGLRVVHLDLARVAAIAASVSGLAPELLRFHAEGPAGGHLAAHWTRTLQGVAIVLADDDLLAHPLLCDQALCSLATAALACFPNTARDAVTDPARPGPGDVGPATVRRAVAFVDTWAHEVIGIDEIADAAGVGPRALQVAFRRHREQTPMEYLRQVRLHRAHLELRAGDPTRGDTVAGIAARWGFGHTGRFAGAYRRAYGHAPGRTLRH